MPINGNADPALLTRYAPTMSSLDTESLTLPDVKVLQVIYEIDDSVKAELLPPALHPTIPPTIHVIGMRAEDGPLGPFTIAIVRVGCRAAVRPRGLPTRAVCTEGEAATALTERWGFPITVGEPALRERYDRQSIEVNDGNVTVLSAQLVDPVPIGNGDLLYTAGMHVANVERDGETKPWLVQVDPDFEVSRADRGSAQIDAFDSNFWDAPDLRPVYPIVASYTTANITLPKIRYICDPMQPAISGTVAL
ncbi:MAG: hypothetical protein F4038_11595 [Chloroflexi bacterium]|nr:hypothetical protein [Chloroflexota bacterium]